MTALNNDATTPETLTSVDDLRTLYRPPKPRAADKVHARIDQASARLIARCPLVLLATADRDGRCDVSPRGGPPGFVTVLDEHHVALPDLGGNNRLDSSSNLVANAHAGLLFVVPGKDETLRINGPAVLTTADAVLDRTHPALRRPKMALVVEAEEVFAHCAKAFRRGRVWQPESWAALADAPDLAEIYACQTDGDALSYREAVAEAYKTSLAAD
jgi:PPOX class probable FMN-dependent enzyme